MNGVRGRALAGLLPKSVMHCCARSCSSTNQGVVGSSPAGRANIQRLTSCK
jgi:hypothetical protein